MPTIKAPDRQQITFMNKLDDMVATDHPVRLLDAIIDRIIGSDPAFFDHLSADGSVGRGGFSARCLIKLLLYGYREGISSSRKLQTQAKRNIEVIWLLSSLAPSYKVIADYRKDHPEQIERVHIQMIKFLEDVDCIDGDRIAIDGVKLKAYTGWDMPDEASLEKRLARAHSQLEEWMSTLAVNDALEGAQELLDKQPTEAGEPEMMETIAGLHEHIKHLQAAKKRLQASDATRLPLSDPEARSMRAPHGTSPPSYNLQAGVDARQQMIVATKITNAPNDIEQLPAMHKHLHTWLGKDPKELLADTGYANLGDIKAIQTHTSTRCYIPENNTLAKKQPIQFNYQPDQDQYRCSGDQVLQSVTKNKYDKTKGAYMDIYRGIACGGCRLQADCTSAADGVRQLKVFHGAEWRYEYAKQIESKYGKERIKERKSIIEHVFGTLRYWMGQIPLKLRGLKKVQTEINLYATGYNIKRYSSLAPIKELMKEVTNWKPKLATQPA